MTKEQRIAIARIICDMIKADNIIEEKEITDMKLLLSKYNITQQDMSDARFIRFSEAVTILQEIPRRERKMIFDHIYKIALSDNVCVPKEVMLLMALQYCLVDNDQERGNKPYLISCQTGEATLSDQYMVYLESVYHSERNEEIKQNFKLLQLQARLSGFNFVYIPKLVEEFKEMDPQYVNDVISYMAPQLNSQVIADVYDRLCQITTTEFFHNVLYEKLQVRTIFNAKPSLLINIGSSIVPYCTADGTVQYYTEFLCIPIVGSVVSLVEDIIDFYQNKVSVKTITLVDNKGQFKYFGFYKALFDFLIAPPPIAPDLIFLGEDIHDGKHYIAFRFSDHNERKVRLMPQYYNLLYQVAYKSYCIGGRGLPVARVASPTMSHLRSTLAEELRDISFIDQYKPEKQGNAYFLRLDSSKVFVRKYHDYNHRDYDDISITEWQG